MYDTLKLWLPADSLNGSDYLNKLPVVINDIKQGYSNSTYYINGYLDGLKLSISDKGVSILGSLCKYYLRDNINTLTRQDTQRAFEQLSDIMQVPVINAKVCRIDTSQNFLMKYEPELYYHYLGECKNYYRLTQPHSLYYSNDLRTKLFYDKIKESKKKRVAIPEIWLNKNVIRYELRYTSRLAKQFNTSMVIASDLYKEEFYTNLIDKWLLEYETIQKNKQFNLNYDTMKQPKDFKDQLFLLKLSELGQVETNQLIDLMKAKNCFEHKEYYSRLKADIKRMYKKHQPEQADELISELSNKIKRVTQYYR